MSHPPTDPPPPGPPRPIPNLAWEIVDNTAVTIVEQRARLGAAYLNAGSVPLERVEATYGLPAEIGATVEASLSTTEADDTISATGFVFPLEWEPDRLELLQQHALLVHSRRSCRRPTARYTTAGPSGRLSTM